MRRIWRDIDMKTSGCLERIFVAVVLMLFVSTAHVKWQASMAEATVFVVIAQLTAND